MAWIDVAIIREAIDKAGVDYTTLALRLGWHYNNKYNTPDATRVRRRLGIVKVQNSYAKKNGTKPYPQKYIMTSTAEAMLRAADIDPVDVGL